MAYARILFKSIRKEGYHQSINVCKDLKGHVILFVLKGGFAGKVFNEVVVKTSRRSLGLTSHFM